MPGEPLYLKMPKVMSTNGRANCRTRLAVVHGKALVQRNLTFLKRGTASNGKLSAAVIALSGISANLPLCLYALIGYMRLPQPIMRADIRPTHTY